MGQEPEAIREDIEDTRGRMGEAVEALAYKADVKSRAKDRVGTMKDKVVGATPDTGDVKDGARQAVGIAQENPLGLAIGAAAIGFVAGLVIPSTRVEDEKVGHVSDQVKEQVRNTASEAVEHGKEVAQEAAASAADTAKQAGQEHGERLQQSARESAHSVNV
jgi:ElaB/YqjD/DUF883 family membrane-anchored ribosome-binding protein